MKSEWLHRIKKPFHSLFYPSIRISLSFKTSYKRIAQEETQSVTKLALNQPPLKMWDWEGERWTSAESKIFGKFLSYWNCCHWNPTEIEKPALNIIQHYSAYIAQWMCPPRSWDCSAKMLLISLIFWIFDSLSLPPSSSIPARRTKPSSLLYMEKHPKSACAQPNLMPKSVAASRAGLLPLSS